MESGCNLLSCLASFSAMILGLIHVAASSTSAFFTAE